MLKVSASWSIPWEELNASPAREESVRLRVFRRIGTFLCKHASQFLRLLMRMFARDDWTVRYD
jgi:hypothetical protein